MTALERPDSQHTQERWRRLEQDLKGLLDGQVTPGSGNQHVKGDVRSSRFLAEAKYRWSYDEMRGFYILLNLQWLEAIWRQAEETTKISLLALEWGHAERAILMPELAYQRLADPDVAALPHITTSLRFVPLFWGELPLPCFLTFSSLEIPAKTWTILDWSEMREIREEHQEPSTPPRRSRLARPRGDRKGSRQTFSPWRRGFQGEKS
jgi:hypothetical protein